MKKNIPSGLWLLLAALILGCSIVIAAILMASPIATPTAQPGTTLREVLTNIHNRFERDPTRGCYEFITPYSEYYKGLQEMTAVLLTDPRAQALSFAEREALFKEVTGFYERNALHKELTGLNGVYFTAGNGAATLVALLSLRGHNSICSSHYYSPDTLHVVDQQGAIYDIGTGGILAQTWWVADRWIALFRLKMDSSSDPTQWGLWQIGQKEGAWQRLMEFEFTPTPNNFFTPPPIRFENGYQTMIADLDYWWAADPCEFTAAFKGSYKHGDWQMRRTYQLVDNTYQLASSEVLTFTVQRKDSDEAVALNWQDYCVGSIE